MELKSYSSKLSGRANAKQKTKVRISRAAPRRFGPSRGLPSTVVWNSMEHCCDKLGKGLFLSVSLFLSVCLRLPVSQCVCGRRERRSRATGLIGSHLQSAEDRVTWLIHQSSISAVSSHDFFVLFFCFLSWFILFVCSSCLEPCFFDGKHMVRYYPMLAKNISASAKHFTMLHYGCR